jgi:cell division protein ZipA
MEESFRNSLIIISALVIGAIFVHGLWTIRKNKNPYKLKAKPKDIEAKEKLQRDFDRSGFDQDGVSQVKVIANQDDEDKGSAIEQATESQVTDSQVTDDVEVGVPEAAELPANLAADEVAEKSDQNQEPLILVADGSEAEIPSLYTDPVSKPKPAVKVKETANVKKSELKKHPKKSSKAALKRDQIEINFGDAANINTDENANKVNIDPEVIAISVIVPQGQIISGAALLPSLLTLGMRYGEMNVFHRHQDSAGNGKVTFSLVNAMNPGTFDLDNMETFVTQGVSLFMTLPNAGDAFEVFEQMLVAAKQLAAEFNGQLLDDKRSVLTKQTEQHYVTKIREFARKSRLASL